MYTVTQVSERTWAVIAHYNRVIKAHDTFAAAAQHAARLIDEHNASQRLRKALIDEYVRMITAN